ncbi:MAG: hypothetical protein AABZ60_17315 [Planctomycetota bacterium]
MMATIKTLDGKMILNQIPIEVNEKEGENLHEPGIHKIYGQFKYAQNPGLTSGKYLLELNGNSYKIVIYRTEFHEKMAYYETLHSS